MRLAIGLSRMVDLYSSPAPAVGIVVALGLIPGLLRAIVIHWSR